MSKSITDEESPYDIFWELAGELRRSILFKLGEKSMKLSTLAKELDATVQEVHRNTNRLIDAGLVKKDADGMLSLTTYGNSVITQIPSFEFLAKNKHYFEEHTFGDLPMKFIQRIGALNNTELINGVVAVLERWKMMYANAQEYIMELMAQVPLDLIEPLVERVKQGIRFSYIFGYNTIVPKGRREILNRLGWQEYIRKGIVERRMCERVEVMVIATDKHAAVLFPDQHGNTDLNHMLFGSDPLFREWCIDFFRYKWYASGSFDESKLKEV
ncbi:MAG: hypothetical protein QXS25_00045 [Candidatus Nitrosocaldus sp.]